MNTLVLLLSTVVCALLGFALIGSGVFFMFNRKNQQPAIPEPVKQRPLNPSEQSNEHSSEQTLSSVEMNEGQQRPNGFFMPLPAQLDSEAEHSETTLIRNVLDDPDSETTLRPTRKGSPRLGASPFSPDRKRSQEPSALPDITENNALPQSLFSKNEQEDDLAESEEDPTAIFTNKT